MTKSKKIKAKVKTTYGIFECIFEDNAPERGYTVTVPKLRGIVTCGDTIEEAKEMAKEAIELHCECLIDEGLAELKLYRHRVLDNTKVPA